MSQFNGIWYEEDDNSFFDNWISSSFYNTSFEDILDDTFWISELISDFEKKNWVNVTVETENKSIFVYSNIGGNLIWEIELSEYSNWTFSVEDHLSITINEKHRQKGWWELIYKLYIDINKLQPLFTVPEEEYTNVVSQIYLYSKFWYIPKYKINKWSTRMISLTKADLDMFREMKEKTSKWEKETKLSFTVVLDQE